MVWVVGTSTQNFAQTHTYTCITQWRLKRMTLKSIVHTYILKWPDTHKFSALTWKMRSQSDKPGSCSSLHHLLLSRSVPVTTRLSPQIWAQPAKSPLRATLQAHFVCKSKQRKSVLGTWSQSPALRAPTCAVHAWHRMEDSRTALQTRDNSVTCLGDIHIYIQICYTALLTQLEQDFRTVYKVLVGMGPAIHNAGSASSVSCSLSLHKDIPKCR